VKAAERRFLKVCPKCFENMAALAEEGLSKAELSVSSS